MHNTADLVVAPSEFLHCRTMVGHVQHYCDRSACGHAAQYLNIGCRCGTAHLLQWNKIDDVGNAKGEVGRISTGRLRERAWDGRDIL